MSGKQARRWINRALLVLFIPLTFAVYVPQVLAFPYRAQVGNTAILSDGPIAPSIGARIARADRLLATSPLNVPGIARTIVLTDGGWRWRVLALTTWQAFALRRPFGSALIFNRSDVGRDKIYNRSSVANVRSLSGTIAHETTHMLVARHVGELHALWLPEWKREGYADYVAHESTLSDAKAAELRRAMPDAGALQYYDARRRVAATLAANGNSVERLFR